MAEEKNTVNSNSGCKEFDENLTSYLEGAGNRDVISHASQCPSCGALLGDLELIRSLAKDLPLESPPPRLWSNIRARLDEEGILRQRESFWRKWVGQISFGPAGAPIAALALALVLALILVFRGDIHQTRIPKPAQTPVTASVVPVGLTGVQDNLVRTVQEMEANYKAREGLLDPAAKQIYQAGLDSLDSSIRECLDSLHKQPHNVLAREYLMQAYAQKADVLASALEYGGR